ncbi:hypothetical protein BIWAKO_05734 [Bosea sp. BIWAKO-01]|nr:hypothetical protein BIWAKO_05734 [Bosea sp. BIWAKO-01]
MPRSGRHIWIGVMIANILVVYAFAHPFRIMLLRALGY